MVCSGDLSHALKEQGPYRYHPSGPLFDQKVHQAIEQKDALSLITMNEDFVEEAAQCGLRSFLFGFGFMDGYDYDPHILSVSYTHLDVYKRQSVHCTLCPHHCKLKDGQTGRCGVRKAFGDKLYSLNYGRISAMHIDPIEKKPIIGWMPGSRILSFGSFGCNFHCGFCQNYEISLHVPYTTEMQPEEIVQWALDNGLPSIAYTYNEPTIFYEMMYDTAILAKGKGLKNVMVTNGFIEEEPLELILDYMDAMNIDLKTYSDEIYRRLGGRSVGHILGTIEKASQRCHVAVSYTHLDVYKRQAMWPG